MKAIRKSDGKVIEVEKAAIGYCEVDVANINGFPMQNFYSEKDLDFDLPEERESAVIEGWVARDEDEDLGLYRICPKRKKFLGRGIWKDGDTIFALEPTLFPSLTWESEPLKVRIQITPME